MQLIRKKRKSSSDIYYKRHFEKRELKHFGIFTQAVLVYRNCKSLKSLAETTRIEAEMAKNCKTMSLGKIHLHNLVKIFFKEK